MHHLYRQLCKSLRRSARGPVILLAVMGLSFSLAGDARADTPNIVYILADDMGLGDIRSYTSTSPVNTPNIDRIANEGMRFTNAALPLERLFSNALRHPDRPLSLARPTAIWRRPRNATCGARTRAPDGRRDASTKRLCNGCPG